MQVHVLVAPVFGANCCVVVSGQGAPGSDAVIVDAGGGVAPAVIALVSERGWRVQAVVATHGHVDHTWDAAALCEHFGAPFRIHADDAYRLADPFGTLGFGASGGVSLALRQAVSGLGIDPDNYRAPADIVTFDADGDENGILVAGSLRLVVIPAPGHTQGSTLFGVMSPEGGGILLTGDVLFAGGIGRTDLPGGDDEVMATTLRDVIGALDPALEVIPGHGPATTIARELATNPYL